MQPHGFDFQSQQSLDKGKENLESRFHKDHQPRATLAMLSPFWQALMKHAYQ